MYPRSSLGDSSFPDSRVAGDSSSREMGRVHHGGGHVYSHADCLVSFAWTAGGVIGVDRPPMAQRHYSKVLGGFFLVLFLASALSAAKVFAAVATLTDFLEAVAFVGAAAMASFGAAKVLAVAAARLGLSAANSALAAVGSFAEGVGLW